MLSVRRAAALLSSAVAVFACSTLPASAAVGGFEGADGNLACAGASDWDCAASTGWKVTVADDASGTDDDVFVSGAKETRPADWQFTSGAPNGKTDILKVRSATKETSSSAYLALGFDVIGGTQSSAVSFELNQARSQLKPGIPCRTDGDIQIDYQLPNGVSLATWDGTGGTASCPDGASGTWTTKTMPATVWEAGINGAATFGETALDLDAVATAAGIAKPCEFFAGLQVHSRESGSSGQAVLSDFVGAAPIGVAACKTPDPGTGGGGGSNTKLDAPTTGAATGCATPGTVVVAGTAAAPASQVRVFDGAGAVGVADVAADGTWSLTLTGVADGSHSYTAVAHDGKHLPSDASAAAPVTVGGCATTTDPGTGGDDPLVPGTGNAGNGTGKAPGGGLLGATATGGGAAETEITSDATPGCATKPFGISIPAKGVKRVVFRVDGKAVKTVRKLAKGKFRLTIDPRKFKVGAHRISAKLVLRNGKTRIVPMRAFARCAVGQCVSRRAFKIHAKKLHGDRIVRATVYVNGKKAGSMKGSRLTKGIDLRGLPQGKVTVVIKGVTAKGRHVNDTRHYKTCTKKSA